MSELTASQRRDFRLLAIFRTFSLFGDEVALVSLFLRFAHHNARWMIAALGVANAIAPMALAAHAGTFVDRVHIKRYLPGVVLAQGVVAVALGVWTNAWLTVGLIALLGCGVAITQPGYSVLLPEIVGLENVPHAQGQLQAYQGVAGIAGPVVGGLLVGAAGLHWPLYLDAMTFGVCALGTLFIRTSRAPSLTKQRARNRGELTAGITLVANDPVMRPVIAECVLFVLSIGAVNVGAVFLVTKTFHATSTTYGIVEGLFMIGQISGSLLAGQIPPDQMRHVRSIFFGAGTIGAMFLVGGLMPNVWLLALFMSIGGIGNGFANVSASTLFTLRAPEALRGRIFAAVGAVFGGAQIIAISLGGVEIGFMSPRTVFVLGGVVSLAAIVLLAPVALRASKRAHDAALVV